MPLTLCIHKRYVSELHLHLHEVFRFCDNNLQDLQRGTDSHCRLEWEEVDHLKPHKCHLDSVEKLKNLNHSTNEHFWWIQEWNERLELSQKNNSCPDEAKISIDNVLLALKLNSSTGFVVYLGFIWKAMSWTRHPKVYKCEYKIILRNIILQIYNISLPSLRVETVTNWRFHNSSTSSCFDSWFWEFLHRVI